MGFAFTLRCCACACAVFAFTTVAAAQTWNNETDAPAELDFVNLQFPSSFALDPGDPTPLIFGRVYEAGVTEPAGASASILSQVGYGPGGSNPLLGGWTWTNANFNVQVGNDDEYMASFAAPGPGSYSYTYRFSLDNGTSWTAADLDGAGSNGGLTFDPSNLGTMTVTPEPSAVALLGAGALALLRRARSRTP